MGPVTGAVWKAAGFGVLWQNGGSCQRFGASELCNQLGEEWTSHAVYFWDWKPSWREMKEKIKYWDFVINAGEEKAKEW